MGLNNTPTGIRQGHALIELWMWPPNTATIISRSGLPILTAAAYFFVVDLIELRQWKGTAKKEY